MNRKNLNNGTAKKATKRAVKKSYKPAAKKKNVPELKGKAKDKKLTVEALAAVMAENHAKTEAIIAKSREETDKAIRASREETDKALQRLTDNVEMLSSNIGSVGNDIGELMEFIVIPKIRLAMNATGKHIFKTMETERKFKKIDELGEKKIFTEVDVLLYGETEVMAVETKSHLFTRDVKKHKERLEMLRRHEDAAGIKGKKLVGAVVGAIVDEGAKRFALESGLYVVTIREEAEKLDVVEPETCRAW